MSLSSADLGSEPDLAERWIWSMAGAVPTAGAGLLGVFGTEVDTDVKVPVVGVPVFEAGDGAEIDTAGMDGISVADFCIGVAIGGVGSALFLPVPTPAAWTGTVEGSAPKADMGRAGRGAWRIGEGGSWRLFTPCLSTLSELSVGGKTEVEYPLLRFSALAEVQLEPKADPAEAEADSPDDVDEFMPVSPNAPAAEAYIDTGRLERLPSSYFLSIRSRIISRLIRWRTLVSFGASVAAADGDLT